MATVARNLLSGSTPPSIVTANLRLYLDAGNPLSYPGSGTTWTDTIQSIQFSLVNGPTYNSANGGYFTFVSGSQQHCQSGTSLGLLLNWTVEAWVLVGNIAGTVASIFTNVFPGGNSNLNSVLAVDATGFYTGTYATGAWFESVKVPYRSNEWVHVVGTYNGSGMSIYINGTFIQFQSQTLTPASNSGGTYLMRHWSSPEFIGGRLAVTRVYSSALTPAQVRQNFNVECGRFGLNSAPELPLVAYDLNTYTSVTNPSIIDIYGGTSATINIPNMNTTTGAPPNRGLNIYAPNNFPSQTSGIRTPLLTGVASVEVWVNDLSYEGWGQYFIDARNGTNDTYWICSGDTIGPAFNNATLYVNTVANAVNSSAGTPQLMPLMAGLGWRHIVIVMPTGSSITDDINMFSSLNFQQGMALRVGFMAFYNTPLSASEVSYLFNMRRARFGV